MPKFDDEFNLKDWEWIAVHFPLSRRESMAKVAWLIYCKCTPREISRYNIDPRIVIPLCGIVLLDEINIIQLKNLKKELSDYSGKIFERCAISEELEIKQEHIDQIKEDVDRITQEFISLVINSTNPRERWLSLFETLDIYLQFSLFSCLIKHRRPNRNDWRNIFQKDSDSLIFIKQRIAFLRVLVIILEKSISATKLFKNYPLKFLLLSVSMLIFSVCLLFYLIGKIPLLTWVIILALSLVLWIYIRKNTNPLKGILQSDNSANIINLHQDISQLQKDINTRLGKFQLRR